MPAGDPKNWAAIQGLLLLRAMFLEQFDNLNVAIITFVVFSLCLFVVGFVVSIIAIQKKLKVAML